MSNTLIQIKRSASTLAPNELADGELAYSGNTLSERLFIGHPADNTVTTIAGAKFQFLHQANTSNATHAVVEGGKLTANAVLITDANSFVNELRTSNLVINTSGNTALHINGIVTDGNLASVSNTTIPTTWAVKDYVDNNSASELDNLTDVTLSSPANNNILVYDATAGQWENHTVSGTTNEVAVTFAGQDLTIGLTSNVTVNNVLTANVLDVTDTSTSSNTTTGAAKIAGGLGVAGKINTAELAVGNTSVYTSVNGSSVSTENFFATNTVNASVLSVGTWVVANNSGLFTSGVVNTNVLQVANSSAVLFTANDTQVTIANGIGLSVNGSIGTANQVLASNGAGLYWRTVDADIEEVTAGDGLTGGGSSGNVTLDVGAGNGIAVNSSAVSVKANNGIVANTDGVFVNPGTGVTVNSTGVHIGQAVGTTDSVTFGTVSVTGNLSVNTVNTSLMPAANVTYNLGNNTMRWAEVHAQNVHSLTGKFDGNVEIAGNLTVSGNVTTTNVNSVVISDPIIFLAANNVADILDIGFVAHYNDGTQRHTGLFRDATDGIYKLFDNYTPELAGNNSVDTSNSSFRISTLFTYLTSGDGAGLNTNATSVSIVANSTVNVSITANSLSLTSALEVASGGTGKSSFTNNAVLFGNTAGALSEATGSNGQVLQITANVPTFGGLDGGTF